MGHLNVSFAVTTKCRAHEALEVAGSRVLGQDRLVSSFTGTKLWARGGKPLCHDWTLKGTGARVETGSASLYGLKTSQPQFPSTTYFYFVSESASHSAPFPCSTLHTHSHSPEAARKPVHEPRKHPGSKSAGQSPKSQTLPPWPVMLRVFWKVGKDFIDISVNTKTYQ